jgi:DNA-binding NtrC family response regulator
MADRAAPRYCLRGAVGGRERRFLLEPGLNHLGSAATGDIVLPVQGVSRRHAAIVVAGEGVELRDLTSKNGTLVNGRLAAEARLRAGDVLQLGAAVLSLEVLSVPADPRDEIAIHFRPPAPARGEAAGGDETSLLEREGREVLAAVERLVEMLAMPATSATSAASATSEVLAAPETAAALRGMVAACGADGAILGEWDGLGEPVVLCTCGEAGAWGAVARELIAPLRPPAPGPAPAATVPAAAVPACRLERRLLDRVYFCGGLERPGRTLLYLLVGGRDERGYSAGLVNIFLRLVDRASPGIGDGGPVHPERGAVRPAPPAARLVTPPGYVRGESAAMRSVYEALGELAQSDLTVLVEGETGVGKECLVRMLHDASPAAGRRPLVAINCAAIPAELLEAELFGVRRGVATGVEARRGRFEEASGGTLFLDEIADLSAGLQGKLLRVLQDHEVQPLGGGAYPLDARIVSATNRSLDREVAQGRFRADLYYRLAGYVLQVPPLRHRRGDIPPLLESLIRRAAADAGKWVRGVTVNALEALVAYPWPGNVRELENEVRRLVQRCPAGSAIDPTMLSETVQSAVAAASAEAPAAADDPDSLDLKAATDRLERRLIERALERTGGNRSQAAKLLGISRNGLADKLDRLGAGSQ